MCQQDMKLTRIVVNQGHRIGRSYTTYTEVLGIKNLQLGTEDNKQPQL